MRIKMNKRKESLAEFIAELLVVLFVFPIAVVLVSCFVAIEYVRRLITHKKWDEITKEKIKIFDMSSILLGLSFGLFIGLMLGLYIAWFM